MRIKKHSGFSLMETLLAVVIVGLLIAILLPALSIVRNNASQRNDAANMKGIFIGTIGYADENNNTYPAYKSDSTTKGATAQGFHSDALHHSSDDKPKAFTNNISAAIWLLARGEYLQPRIFINPSSTDTAQPIDRDKTLWDYYDFASPDHLSYSFNNMYSALGITKWTSAIAPTSVVASNDNNGIYGTGIFDGDIKNSHENANDESRQMMNSYDHNGKGQNMLYGDGHVEFKTNPLGAYNDTDNVYTWLSQGDKRSDAESLTALRNGKRDIVYATTSAPVLKHNRMADDFLLPVSGLKK